MYKSGCVHLVFLGNDMLLPLLCYNGSLFPSTIVNKSNLDTPVLMKVP